MSFNPNRGTGEWDRHSIDLDQPVFFFLSLTVNDNLDSMMFLLENALDGHMLAF